MSTRDYAMARLGAALVFLDWAKASANTAMENFVDASDDPKGEERSEGLGEALAFCHEAACVLQETQNALDAMSPSALRAGEGTDDEEEDDEEEEDEDIWGGDS